MMVGLDYTEKMMKDFFFNHAKDFGRFYCQMMIESPKLAKEFTDGFTEEMYKPHEAYTYV
jgi:hypothetical protein